MALGGDPYKQLLRDQPFEVSSLAWNRLMEVARQRDIVGASGGAVAFSRDLARLKVRNNSGSPVGRFGILGLSTGAGPIITPSGNLAEFLRQPILSGATPGSADVGLFCVALEAIPPGSVGWAAVSGVVPVQVIGAAANQADVLAGDSTQLLMTSGGSAQVLWADSGNGTRWALVRLAPLAPVVSVPDCSQTVDGTVNLTTQVLGSGDKSFFGNVYVGCGTAISGSPGTVGLFLQGLNFTAIQFVGSPAAYIGGLAPSNLLQLETFADFSGLDTNLGGCIILGCPAGVISPATSPGSAVTFRNQASGGTGYPALVFEDNAGHYQVGQSGTTWQGDTLTGGVITTVGGGPGSSAIAGITSSDQSQLAAQIFGG